jgi:tetratricopeptide (TPR) repeat protein
MRQQDLKFLAVFVAAALCLPPAARAAYDDLGVSPRVVGLSNAFTAVADDAYAVYYNPAGLATLERPEMAASYARLLNGLSDGSNIQNSFLTYALPIDGGRQGTAGMAVNYFSLQGLYQETSLFGSYGRRLFEESLPDQLYGGLSLKFLDRSVTPGAAASQPLTDQGYVATGVTDPALQRTSKSNLDVDAGMLYRPQPRWSLGLMIQHMFEPNIAFSPSDTDRLGRNVKFGAAYHTPFSLVSLDLDLPTAPDGSLDKIGALAVEKWIPTLLYGEVALRGSLAAGTRDYRQLGVGISYKIFRMQFDYGFTIPLGGLATSGSQRIGLTYRFGRSKVPQPSMGDAILENIRDLAEVGTPEFRYQMEELTLFKRNAIDEFLRQAKVEVGTGHFADALVKIDDVASLKPGDPKVADSQARLRIISDIYPEVKDFYSDPAQAALYDAALKFISGKDKEALGNLVYASGLYPGDTRIEALIKAIEKRTGVSRATATATPPGVTPAEAAPGAVAASTAPASEAPTVANVDAAAEHTKQLVEGYMALMEVSFRQSEYEKVIQLAKQVVELDDSNVLAYKRMGAAYHALKRYPEALAALKSALKRESDPEARKSLRSYISALESVLQNGPSGAAPRPSRPQPASLSPDDVERLYESGVDLYSRGQLTEAAAAFRQILTADPDNVSARRALKRVEAEMVQSGETR